ncbi:MAG TPA: nicotinate-nucleotide adenylyltransferase [Thermoleophilaceae bacterium]|nr:nicotinate-nucleotide adenylyltransferase [Thermoleophilaceae bacterium]
MRLGILGGVFNPPHLGHLVCAQEACVRLELDRVLLVPVGEAPHREVEDPGTQTRLELCQAATGDDDRLGCSRVEIDRPGPSYTVDTLHALRDERGEDEDLVLILGADQAAELRGWRDPEGVLALAEVAVVERADLSAEAVRARVNGLAGAERLSFFSMPRIDVSSTLVRRRVADGLPIRYLVPDAVVDLIAERGLYRARVGTR